MTSLSSASQTANAEDGGAYVHVIDDDPSVRHAICSLLRSVEIRAIPYESPREFQAAELADAAGCLLLDVRMPGMSGLDFQARVDSLGIRMPIIMMTAHGDIPMSVQAMKAGAVDFLTKPFRDQDLIDAVALAIEKDKQRREAEHHLSRLRALHGALTDREKQVMALVTRGLLNKQAAFELGLSEITVKIHRASAMKKMGARSLAELVKMSERLTGL